MGITASTAPLIGAIPIDSAFADPLPDLQGDDASVFAEARRRLFFPTSVTYCNTGTWGAVPRDVVAATNEALSNAEVTLPDWNFTDPNNPNLIPPAAGYASMQPVLEEVGALVNAPAKDLALTQNCTVGMGLLANGIDLAAGDQVVMSDQEHPSGIEPWRLKAARNRIEVIQAPTTAAFAGGPAAVVDAFARVLTPRTRVIVYSQITSTIGARMPVREICALARDRGILSIVDGAQAVGQMAVDLTAIGCDAFVTNGHKWLCARKGTGFLYVREAVQERFWATLATGRWQDTSLGAHRLTRSGTAPLAEVFGLRAAIRYANALGIPRIQDWDRMLTQRLRSGFASMPHVHVSSPTHVDLTAAMTTFTVDGLTSTQVQHRLWADGRIRVRAEGEAGARLSAHYYAAPADIDRVLEIVSSLRR
jgi:selenocysteine lyase/cysteine desulfurase